MRSSLEECRASHVPGLVTKRIDFYPWRRSIVAALTTYIFILIEPVPLNP